MKKNYVCGRSVPINFILLFRVMKLFLLFLVIFNLSVVAGTNAQVKRVSLTMENAELRQVFKKLKQQTGLRFFYNEEKLKREGIRQIDVRNLELNKALDEILGGTDLTYTFLKDVVVIKDRQQDRIAAILKEKRLITGVVRDEKGIPLPGVSVIVKGTQTGVATNVDGHFEIKVDDQPELILLFSFVGMKNKEVRIGNSRELKIILENENENLDEVIVTGYQTLSKERATGAFGVVTPKTLENKLQSNLASLLEGQAAGVVLDQEGKIEIRGVSTFNAEKSPLVVVDGYPIEGGLETINPEIIENITILKDGVAASIYGSRAANGVIVVATTRGKADEFKVSYKGILNVMMKPDLSDLHRASTSDYIDAEIDIFNQAPNTPSTMSKNPMGRVTWLLMQVREGNISQADAMAEINQLRKVDGLKQAEKYYFRNQLSHQHNLMVSGGNDKNRFNAAINYLDHRGFIIKSDDSRLIFDIKNDWNPTKYVSLGLLANVVYQKNNESARSWRDLLEHDRTSLIQPYDNLVDENGKPTTIFSTSPYKIENYKVVPGMKEWTYNPIDDLGKEMRHSENIQTRLGGNLRINLIEGLNIETGGMWTRGNTVEKTEYSRDAYWMRIAYNDGTSKKNNSSHYIPDGAMIDETRNINESWTIRTQINFNRSFMGDKHRVTFLAGNEVRKSTYNNNEYESRLGYNSMAGSFVPVNNKDYSAGLYDVDMLMGRSLYLQQGSYQLRDNRFVSWYGNASYEYDNRYLLSGSVRLDLTNFFGTDTKYRYKPLWSIGGTWKLSEEKFFDVFWIDRMNIRGSYGINGNISLNEGPFLILSVGSYSYMTSGVSYGVASPPNNQLRWEKTSTTNIGTDVAIFDGRMNLTLDYYMKNSSDLLAKDAIDPTTGFSSLTKNAGKMTNRGIEITVGADVIRQKNFLWNANFNFSYNKNKVKEYNINRPYVGSWTGSPMMAKGYPADGLFGLRYAGLNKEGGAMGYTANGEKQSLAMLAAEDVVYLGSVRPKYNLSFTNTFKYKDIQLSFMLIAKLGHKYMKDCFDSYDYRNRHVADRWMKEGDEATKIYPRLSTFSTDMYYFAYCDFLASNASYMKLRDVTLTYTLPRNWLQPIGLSDARIYFQGRNLWTVTAKGTDVDPESVGYSTVDIGGGYTSIAQGVNNFSIRPEFYVGLSFSF